MPQKIIIVRHGETQYNVEHRLQGWTNIPLNENGHQQAKRVAERLSQENITAIYSSDHKRAYMTARHIAKKLGLVVKKRQALRENSMGTLEGWRWEQEPDAQKEQLWEEHNQAYIKEDLLWKGHGGESIGEHTGRVRKFLKIIEKKHEDDTIIIVSHGGTINRIMEIYGFKKISDDYIGYQNTSVTILRKTGNGYKVELHNDISHL